MSYNNEENSNEMNSDDDALVDSGGCDKDNSVLRTRPEQINLIISFVKEKNNGDGIEKAAFTVMWEHLSKQLNDLGPPIHTVKKWKRIWSVYKYNNKSRFSEIMDKENQTNAGDQNRVQNSIVLPGNSMESNTELVAEYSLEPHTVAEHSLEPHTVAEYSLEPHTENNSHRTEVHKLSMILQHQKVIIEKLDKHEDILNDIVNKI